VSFLFLPEKFTYLPTFSPDAIGIAVRCYREERAESLALNGTEPVFHF
jgi:hypothetical protein